MGAEAPPPPALAGTRTARLYYGHRLALRLPILCVGRGRGPYSNIRRRVMSLGRDMWAQDFAAVLGLSASPSRLGGTHYASGGARTGPLIPGQFPPTSPSWSG